MISLRLGCRDNDYPQYIDSIIDLINKNKGCFDEVWLATSYALPSVNQAIKQSENMIKIAENLRKNGISVSMQISRTIGHSVESLYNYPNDFDMSVFTAITDIDGNKSNGVFCWNNKNFRDYWCQILSSYARFLPDRIWIDDDIRLRLMGVSKALCFCDNCIDGFNKLYGTDYDRITLKSLFINDVSVRKAYIKYQTDTISSFAYELFTAINKVSPDSVPCLQNGGSTSLVVDAQRGILEAMEKASGKIPAFRAGGGFYNDHCPDGLFQKSLTLNYMNSRLPDFVKDKSCEIENLPHTAYAKSKEFTCIEGAVYIGMGCNELSVTLMNSLEYLDFNEREFKHLARYRKFFEKYIESNKDTFISGISTYQPDNSLYCTMNENMEPFWNETCIWEGKSLMRIGLPFNASPDSDVYLITPKTVSYISENDMEFLSAKTVLTDMNTVVKLIDKGFGKYILCDAEALPKQYVSSLSEIMTFEKDAPPYPLRYTTSNAYYVPKGESIEAFSGLYCRKDGTFVGNGISVIPTVNKANWVVSSQRIVDDEIPFSRREALRLALNKAGGNISAFVSSPEQMMIIPRLDLEGEVKTVLLLSVSVMGTEDFSVSVKHSEKTKAVLSVAGNEDIELPLIKGNEYDKVNLPPLSGWHCCLLTFI